MWFTVTFLDRLLLSVTPVVLLHEHIIFLATSIQAASVHVMLCHLLVSHGSRGVLIGCTSHFVCFPGQRQPPVCPWLHTVCTLSMNVHKPKHMSWYRWCKTTLTEQFTLAPKKLQYQDVIELNQVLHGNPLVLLRIYKLYSCWYVRIDHSKK